MALTPEDVLKLAQLARLELTPDEVAQYQRQLDEVLGYVAQLQELSSGAMPPRTAVELRPDEVSSFSETGRLVAAAPEHDERFIVVPPVFDDAR